MYTMSRFGGCKPIIGKDFGKPGKELLDKRLSGKERGTAEGKLRGRRGYKMMESGLLVETTLLR